MINKLGVYVPQIGVSLSASLLFFQALTTLWGFSLSTVLLICIPWYYRITRMVLYDLHFWWLCMCHILTSVSLLQIPKCITKFWPSRINSHLHHHRNLAFHNYTALTTCHQNSNGDNASNFYLLMTFSKSFLHYSMKCCFCQWFSSKCHSCIDRREIMVHIYVHLTNLYVQKHVV